MIACEESQEVCKAFRALGHEAYSCDILPCSGGHPEWHIHDDVLKHLSEEWDMMLAFPPCTYLSNVGLAWFNEKKYGDKAKERKKKRLEAFDFVKSLSNAPIKKICIENPKGWLNSHFRNPNQIIHPYFFGDPFQKMTCLWLKGLQPLDYDKLSVKKPRELYICQGKKCKGGKIGWVEGLKGVRVKDRSKIRSKTFSGIARAMAAQWGKREDDK